MAEVESMAAVAEVERTEVVTVMMVMVEEAMAKAVAVAVVVTVAGGTGVVGGAVEERAVVEKAGVETGVERKLTLKSVKQAPRTDFLVNPERKLLVFLSNYVFSSSK